MSNQFTFYGKIAPIKDSERFHPTERRKYESGWMQTSVKFNIISGTNRIMCLAQGGCWSDDSKNVIHTFSNTINEATKKRDKLDIAWAKRNDPEVIASVAGFKHFVIDTGDYQKRYRLQDAVKAFENGTITDELMDETGCFTIEEAKEAFEKSNKKKHVFLSEYDFSEFCTKLVASDKIKDSIFRITGSQELQYNPEKDRFYANYRVQRIELAKADTPIDATMNIDFYFGENAIDDEDFAESGKALVNGWTTYYDSRVSKNAFSPISVVIRDEKLLKGLKRKMVVDDNSIKNIGLVVDVIEGAEMTPITLEDLDEETQDDISCGLLSFEDVVAALGGNKAGDKVSELRITGLNPKKNKVGETTYTVEDMHPGRVETTKEAEDIFSDDEDEL